ncbi:MAG: hypothetical protein QNI91_15985 [Arenicellales bacterium]|nr:hypothetical protein [Arenicellales bacterium]
MLSESSLVCWKCGASLETLSLPLRRLDVCPECDSELHVCRMCRFFDPNSIDQCTQEDAEEVREKERANFCDYYKPQPGAYQSRDTSQSDAAKDKLNALFGDSSGDGSQSTESSSSPRQELEDLFKPNSEK